MSKRLKYNLRLIDFLTDSIAPNQFKLVLKSLSTDQVNAISEIAANVLYGNIPISDYYKKTLKKFKSKIEAIGNSKNKLSTRKNLIVKEPKLVKLILLAASPVLKTIIK